MTHRVHPDQLAQLAVEILAAAGVGEADGRLVADSLVQADLWGHQSHGVLRLPWYVTKIRGGSMLASVEPEVLIDGGSLVLLDGKNGLGQVIAERARTTAEELAKAHGVGVVGVRNSNHFGTAMYYTRRAAAEGFASILTTNASPAMAPWGGREKRVGTNPWSIGAPWRGRVLALDIANTAVARGKIYLAKQRDETIPDYWALDGNGEPTTDPAAAIAGTILPMAGHKGYAISFMMDVLSGALTGSAVATQVAGPYDPRRPGGVGHLFIAIDVATLGSMDEYNARVDKIVEDAKTSPLAAGMNRIYHPGEIEDLHELAVIEEGGLTLPDQTLSELTGLVREAGLVIPGWLDRAPKAGAAK